MLRLLSLSLLVRQASTGSTTASCQPCLSIFTKEFDKSKVTCVSSSAVTGTCDCTFKFLDLSSCAYMNMRDKQRFNIIVNTAIISMPENKYSSQCRHIIQAQGSCTLGDVSDQGFVIPTWSIVFGMIGLLCQFLSMYRLVGFWLHRTTEDFLTSVHKTSNQMKDKQIQIDNQLADRFINGHLYLRRKLQHLDTGMLRCTNRPDWRWWHFSRMTCMVSFKNLVFVYCFQ